MRAMVPLGINYNFTQLSDNVAPARKFEMVRDAGVFDYINWLPRPELLAGCVAASERTGIPMTTGNCMITVGDPPFSYPDLFATARRAGNTLVNVMLMIFAADGHCVTDDEVVDAYLRCLEAAERHGIVPAFEVHVNCWSEEYPRVERVADLLAARGVTFNLTIDYSHCVFKIGNPEELAISGVADEVASGQLILDPFEPGNLCDRWLARNIVAFAQYRPAVPNGPRNVWALENGAPGRGIQYPFVRPAPGEWHSPWYAYLLEPSKEAFRHIIDYHLTHPDSPLQAVITEMIVQPDYGMNAKYSVFDHSVACARWIRETWNERAARVLETVS